MRHSHGVPVCAAAAADVSFPPSVPFVSFTGKRLGMPAYLILARYPTRPSVPSPPSLPSVSDQTHNSLKAACTQKSAKSFRKLASSFLLRFEVKPETNNPNMRHNPNKMPQKAPSFPAFQRRLPLHFRCFRSSFTQSENNEFTVAAKVAG